MSRSRMVRDLRWFVVVVFTALLAAACRSEPADGTRPATRVVPVVHEVTTTPVEVTRLVEEVVQVTVVPTPTPTPAPAKHLKVCLTHEPRSLYPYGGPLFGPDLLAKLAVQHAVYEELYTTLAYGYQARGLEKMPTLDDGDAEIGMVTAEAGDRVLDAEGHVVTLRDGVILVDASGAAGTFDGTPVEMAQMVVRFQLRPMVWSDGMPVTADDSVFAFEIAADRDTPASKTAVERTASYVALDDLTLAWTGLPGWLDPTYFTNVWPPLPRHQLGSLSAAELLTAGATIRQPFSTGPFVVEEWVEGEYVRLVRNDHYYRRDEGLPRLDAVTFEFVAGSDQVVARLLSGDCHVGTQAGIELDHIPVLQSGELTGAVAPYFQASTVFEHIDFGIMSEEGYAATRPAWFDDPRARQAFALCTDRQRMVDELLYGLPQVMHSYVPAGHPLQPADLTTYGYDPAQANTLLDELGYRDSDGDGLRNDPLTGRPFQVTLSTDDGSDLRPQLYAILQENLRACGVEVLLQTLPAEAFFDPRGPLFGRRFDLAAFPWLTGLSPACDIYLTEEIPTEANDWRGKNATGWSNAAYDLACRAALAAPFGSAQYTEQYQIALRLFAQNLPVIPLFAHLKIAATTPQVQNFHLDPTQPSELHNLYEIDLVYEVRP